MLPKNTKAGHAIETVAEICCSRLKKGLHTTMRVSSIILHISLQQIYIKTDSYETLIQD